MKCNRGGESVRARKGRRERERGPILYYLNPLTTIVQKSILPLRDRNRAYMHGFQHIRSNVFLINIKF